MNPSGGVTIESCTSACQNAGYPLSGTEYADECYCGSSFANGGAPTPLTDCNMACAANASEFCGGPDRLNVSTLCKWQSGLVPDHLIPLLGVQLHWYDRDATAWRGRRHWWRRRRWWKRKRWTCHVRLTLTLEIWRLLCVGTSCSALLSVAHSIAGITPMVASSPPRSRITMLLPLNRALIPARARDIALREWSTPVGQAIVGFLVPTVLIRILRTQSNASVEMS